MLPLPGCSCPGLFQPEAVASLVNEHIEGRRDHAQRLWTLLMLELWFRNHVDSTR
jgi:asparagine synthase (glutamine-hydrolysing)